MLRDTTHDRTVECVAAREGTARVAGVGKKWGLPGGGPHSPLPPMTTRSASVSPVAQYPQTCMGMLGVVWCLTRVLGLLGVQGGLGMLGVLGATGRNAPSASIPPAAHCPGLNSNATAWGRGKGGPCLSPIPKPFTRA